MVQGFQVELIGILSEYKSLLLVLVLLLSHSRIKAPNFESSADIFEISLLGQLVNDAHAGLQLELIDYLLRLIGMLDVVRELLKVPLQALILLLVINKGLLRLQLGSFVPILSLNRLTMVLESVRLL